VAAEGGALAPPQAAAGPDPSWRRARRPRRAPSFSPRWSTTTRDPRRPDPHPR